MSVGPSAHLSADQLSCCLPTFISVCTFICLSACQLSSYLPICVYLYLPVCRLVVLLSSYLPICMYLYLLVCLPISCLVFLPSYLCVPLFACLPTSCFVVFLALYMLYLYLPFCRSVFPSCLLTSISVRKSVYLPVCLLACLTMYQSASLSVLQNPPTLPTLSTHSWETIPSTPFWPIFENKASASVVTTTAEVAGTVKTWPVGTGPHSKSSLPLLFWLSTHLRS